MVVRSGVTRAASVRVRGPQRREGSDQMSDTMALIIAERRYLAEDAAELIEIDYDDIADPVMDYDTALAGDGNDVHPNRPGNVVMQMAVPLADDGRAAVEGAAHVVSQTFVQ